MRSFSRIRLFAVLLTSLALPAILKSIELPAVIADIRREVRPDAAITSMRQIHSTDRYFTFSAFQQTAAYLRTRMRETGLEQVEIVQAPADGKTQVGFWTMPLAWDAKSAHLELIDARVPTGQRVLADYQRIPASLGMWSGPTRPGGIETDMVFVSRDGLRHPEKLAVRGKLVLTDINPAGVKSALVKAGALGAVNTFTENPDLANGRQWINSWGDSGWAFTQKSTPLLSFSITPAQATLVRKLLESGPVRVRATVDTRYYQGSYPYVTGIIRGTSDEETLVLAHTSEQGAHDNATGISATLEAVATLNRLIANGKLPRPRRNIRVLLMGEMYGSMHYVSSNPERVRRTLAAMCVDTPAASYELAGTEYTFHMNPHVAKDFTDALILKVASTYFPLVRRPWHEKEFTTGTDTYLAEPMVGIPTVWSYSGSGVETHHNSEDTPDRVDPRSLRDLSIVTAAFLYATATAGETDVPWLAELSETRAYGQILRRTDSALDSLNAAHSASDVGEVVAQAEQQLAYAVDREKQSVWSALRVTAPEKRGAASEQIAPAVTRLQHFGDEQRARVRNAAQKRLDALAPGRRVQQLGSEAPAVSAEAMKIVVRRKRFGTIPLDDLPQDQWEGQPSGAWATVPAIALYWCDGKRNLAEVVRLTEMELGPTKFDFVSYFRFLRKHGYVEFVSD